MVGADEIIHGVEAVIDVIQAINPKRSGIITVKNHSTQLLWRVHEHSEHGRFATDRADSIPPGGQDSFGVMDSENSFMTGCEGTIKYNAGGMGQAEWTIHWDLPAVGSNSSDHELIGDQASLYSAVEDEPTGGHDKVRFNFSLVGGPPAVTPHVDPPHVDPPHVAPPHVDPPHVDPPHVDPPHVDPAEPEYTPPVDTAEPTLRHGDKSVDGWVEYLQQMLNERGYGVLAVDGDFGNGTYQAVYRYQSDKGLMADGVVGNQTWASLRNEAPRDPSTDGRDPHTFVEQGPEARWHDADGAMHYEEAADLFFINAVSTGDEPLMGGQFQATARFTTANGEMIHYLEIVAPNGVINPGEYFYFALSGARALIGEGIVNVEAYLPSELGGDQITDSVLIPYLAIT
jgi:hypothetical protein